jgi:hypothetical protein
MNSNIIKIPNQISDNNRPLSISTFEQLTQKTVDKFDTNKNVVANQSDNKLLCKLEQNNSNATHFSSNRNEYLNVLNFKEFDELFMNLQYKMKKYPDNELKMMEKKRFSINLINPYIVKCEHIRAKEINIIQKNINNSNITDTKNKIFAPINSLKMQSVPMQPFNIIHNMNNFSENNNNNKLNNESHRKLNI